MLDAYTVKKAAPRILLAVIAVNLSIYLCIAAIDVTNIVGRGLNQLLVTPFVTEGGFSALGETKGFQEQGIQIEASATNNIVGLLAIGGFLGAITLSMFAVAGATSIVLLGFLLPMIIVVALLALAVLFTLIIRQGLLIFLTVVSPIAFVCYILPGTEKFFKQWADLFTRTLMVYPIIAIIFAMSNVLAIILLSGANSDAAIMLASPASAFQHGLTFAQASDGLGLVKLIVAVLLIYAPLVMIPFAFKLAGGAMAQVMGLAQNSARKMGSPVREAGKKYRSRKIPEKMEAARQGNYFKHGHAGNFRGRLNRGIQAAGTTDKWVSKNPRRWAAGIRNVQKDTARNIGDEAAQKDPQLESLNGDDGALRAGLLYSKHHSSDQLQQDLLSEKYTSQEYKNAHNGQSRSWEDLTTSEKSSLRDDQQRVQQLYKTHGTGSSRAFFSKLMTDPNPFKEREVDATDDKGNKIQNEDGTFKQRTQTVAEQVGQAAVDAGNGDFNEVVRYAMKARAHLAQNGRGDIADVSAGTFVAELQKANAPDKNGNRVFGDENAQTIITNGALGKDVIEQVRQKPYAVKAKAEAMAKRISVLTDQGNTDYKTLGEDKRIEFEKLTTTLYALGEGIGDTYASAEVRQRVKEAVKGVENDKNVKSFMAERRQGAAQNIDPELQRRIDEDQAAAAKAAEPPPEA